MFPDVGGFFIAGFFHGEDEFIDFESNGDNKTNDGRDKIPEIDFYIRKFCGVFGIAEFAKSCYGDDCDVDCNKKQG